MEHMKKLLSCISQKAYENLDEISTEEMYKIADIMKDLSESMYHMSIVKSMEDKTEMDAETYRAIDKATKGRMYYTEMMAEDRFANIEPKDRMKVLEDYAKEMHENIIKILGSTPTENEKQLVRNRLQVIMTKL